MKAISAAIVVLAGAICFAVGSLVNHGDTQAFVMLAGGAVALVGLWQWFSAMRHRDDSMRL